ncbi:MAG: hypothetical protein DIKNOCCD_01121 [bacterium]|nr:hypothetical protein [bacterium]
MQQVIGICQFHKPGGAHRQIPDQSSHSKQHKGGRHALLPGFPPSEKQRHQQPYQCVIGNSWNREQDGRKEQEKSQTVPVE